MRPDLLHNQTVRLADTGQATAADLRSLELNLVVDQIGGRLFSVSRTISPTCIEKIEHFGFVLPVVQL